MDRERYDEMITSLDRLENDIDIHTKTASDIFHVEEADVTKEMRRISKAVNFGIIYGISGYGLGENLDISASEAKKYIDKYLTLYPEVNNYMKNIVEEAKKTAIDMRIMKTQLETEMKNAMEKIDEVKQVSNTVRSLSAQVSRLEYNKDNQNERRIEK